MLPTPGVINFKFTPKPQQKYYITPVHEELWLLNSSHQMKHDYTYFISVVLAWKVSWSFLFFRTWIWALSQWMSVEQKLTWSLLLWFCEFPALLAFGTLNIIYYLADADTSGSYRFSRASWTAFSMKVYSKGEQVDLVLPLNHLPTTRFSWDFSRNLHAQSDTQFLQACGQYNVIRKLRTISDTYQNPPSSNY